MFTLLFDIDRLIIVYSVITSLTKRRFQSLKSYS